MKKEKVLIIEDELIIALNIRNMLETKGYKVCDTGISAEEAVEMTEKHNPHLILMDIVLDGEKDGVTAVEKIKKNHNIPVIYITAHSNEKILKRAKKTGPYGYITKPINEQELFAAVEIALYKHEMEMKLNNVENNHAAAQEKERMFKETEELSGTGSWSWIVETDTVQWSHGLYRIMGRDVQLPAPTFAELDAFYAKESWEKLGSAVERTLNSGEPYELELEMVHTNGQVRYTLTHGKAVKDESGRVVRLYGTVQDITERKKMEDDLKLQNEMMINISEGLYLVRANDGIIVYANQKFEEMFGYSPGEMEGKHISIVNAPSEKNPEETAREIIKVLEETGEWHGETENIKKDGTHFWCQANISSFKHSRYGKVWISSHTDITDTIVYKKRLQESEKRMADFIDSATDAFVLLDAELNLLKINKTAMRIMPDGTTEEDLIGKNILDISSDLKETGRYDKYLEVIKTGVPEHFDDLIPEKKFGNRHFSVEAFKSGEGLGISFRDVTEQKNMQNDLIKSEKKLKESQYIAKMGQWELNLKSNELYWSDGIYKLFEIDPDKFIPTYEAFLDAIHPEDRELVNKAYADSLKNKIPYNITHRLLMKDGRVKYVNEICRTEYDDEGKPVLSIGIVQNISEIMFAKEALQKSRQSLIEAQKLARTGSIEWYELTDEIILSEQMYEILSLNPGVPALTRDELKRIYHPDYIETIIEKTGNVLSKGIIESFDAQILSLDGKTKDVHITARPNIDSSDNIIGLFGTFQDITERKKTEKKLHWLSRAVEESPASVVITNKDGIIEYINPKFIEVTGYTKEEAMGQNPRILNSGEQPDEYFKELWETILSGKEWYGEFCNRKKGGEIYWESTSISSIKNVKGEITHFVAVKENITERKRIDAELLEAKDAANEANRAKSRFLANMSHELRTPLNGIIGFSQILQSKYGKSMDDKQMEYISHIRNSGDHLLEMVNDILDLSKIEAGKSSIEKKPFDIGTMLSRSPSALKAIALKKNVRMNVNIETDLGWLDGDEVRIKQVIFNLLSNAIKFTESGKRVGIDAGAEEDLVIITVWDEGIGISGENIDKIFNPFVQIKDSKASGTMGTGLGLSISKKLVELHAGTLIATSKPGEGSRFTVTLPNRINVEDDPDSKVKTHTYMEPDKSENILADILIVEDNELNMELIKEGLGTSGFKIDYVQNGEDALEHASKKTYNLVLMDIQLPDMDGVKTMKKMRQIFSKHVPIIATTAYAMKGDREKYLEEGFDEYISKPLDLNLLKVTINNLLTS